jgi:peptidoglycan/xylan/chitin deacetylase (PgdA/CDA1 family)
MFGSEKHASQKSYMNKEDLKELAKRQLLGTHSDQHLPLATLSAKEIEAEIVNSMDALEQLSGQRVSGISYPYGGKSAVSDELFSITKNCGLQYGFTMERGINTAHDANPYALRRIDTNDVVSGVREDISLNRLNSMPL